MVAISDSFTIIPTPCAWWPCHSYAALPHNTLSLPHSKRTLTVLGRVNLSLKPVVAGVSVAFGAPVGGLLLAIEEGASFLSAGIFWRGLLATCTGVLTLQVLGA